MPPQISVIIPTYRGEERIEQCLDDLAAQTLAPDLFEIVVVQNGPPTRTPELVRAWALRHPEHSVRLIETEVASAQHARNIALDGPTAEWIAFVDDDDRLQPRYLEALWDAASPGVVTYGRVAMVLGDRIDQPVEEIWLTSIPRTFVGRPATTADLWPGLHPAWAKLAERSVIGPTRFDRRLKYADDTVFWIEVLARSGAGLALTDFRPGSAYLWLQREGSITRSGVDGWTQHVERKLDAIAAVRRVMKPSRDPALRAAAAAVSDWFWADVQAYEQANPQHARRVEVAIKGRKLDRVSPRRRSAATVGSLVAHISTPLQAIHLLEYCSVSGAKPDLVVIGDCLTETSLEQTRAVMAQAPEYRLYFQQRTGGWVVSGQGAPALRRELEAALMPIAPITRFIVGNYRQPVVWEIVNALGLDGADVVVLDDGTATLEIDRPLELARAVEPVTDPGGFDYRPPARLTFFTTFAEQIKTNAQDTVVLNRQTVMRSHYTSIRAEQKLTFVVGTPLSEMEIVGVPGLDVEIARLLVDEAKAWEPEATVVYIAHRFESEAKRAAVAQFCELLAFDLPFEMIPPRSGWYPARLVGLHSTLIPNLVDLTQGGVSARIYVPPAEVIRAMSRQAFIDEVPDLVACLDSVEALPLPLALPLAGPLTAGVG